MREILIPKVDYWECCEHCPDEPGWACEEGHKSPCALCQR